MALRSIVMAEPGRAGPDPASRFSVPVATVGVLVILFLTGSTLITLVLIPAVYSLFHAGRGGMREIR